MSNKKLEFVIYSPDFTGKISMYTYKDSISIITPNYNCAPLVSEAIESVLSQTHHNWELIIVDDCSTDGSEDIIELYVKRDSRIRFFKTESNTGMPAVPRNIGLKEAKGRYIAFLDSDDVWFPKKMENQLKVFRETKNAAIVFSNYEKMTEDGNRNNRIVEALSSVTYKQLLKGNCIGCLTAMYDTEKVGKHYFQYIYHEDYAYWLAILQNNYIAKNTNTIEASYRIRSNSKSSKKIKSMKWTWSIYRKFLKFSIIKSLYYYCFYLLKAIRKNIT